MSAIARLDARAFRAPAAAPVATSFGVMRDRPAVFVRIEAADGAFGWGEIFANWPAAGAEHRARLVIEDIADLVLGFRAEDPAALRRHLEEKTFIRALQCGEQGPFAQAIAGLDAAMHDLFARRAGLPLARFLNPRAPLRVPLYASGIHIRDAARLIPARRARGDVAFKVKIGFHAAADPKLLAETAAGLGPGERLMADANQAWTLDEALAFAAAARDLPLAWLEEPLRADMPAADWARVAAASRAPLAAGENVAGEDAFAALIGAGHVGVIQPDVAKWGGVSGCLSVARAALAAGRLFCPHFLGGGVGLLTSAHLLAAAGGPGLLEADANPNPLRDAFFTEGAAPGGTMALAEAPGIGVAALPEALLRFETLRLSRRA